MKKGFTLFELAIVLIVIGLLLGMAMKGKALVEAARIKSDVAKVQKISSAFYTYYSKYNKIPGEKADGSYSDKSIGDELMKEGLIKQSDLVLKIAPVNIHFVGCEEAMTRDDAVIKNEGKRWINKPVTASSNVCIYAHENTWSDNSSKETVPMITEISCYWDKLLDDNFIYGGEGRKVGATHISPFLLKYKDCSTYKNMTTNTDQPMDFSYLFKIYSIK